MHCEPKFELECVPFAFSLLEFESFAPVSPSQNKGADGKLDWLDLLPHVAVSEPPLVVVVTISSLDEEGKVVVVLNAEERLAGECCGRRGRLLSDIAMESSELFGIV